MGARCLRDDVLGGVVGAGRGMREGRSSNVGEGSNEVEDGTTNRQAESENTNQNSPTESNRHPVYLPGYYSGS